MYFRVKQIFCINSNQLSSVLLIIIKSLLSARHGASHFLSYKDALAKSSQPTPSENAQQAASFLSLFFIHIQLQFDKYVRAYSLLGLMLIILGDKMVSKIETPLFLESGQFSGRGEASII